MRRILIPVFLLLFSLSACSWVTPGSPPPPPASGVEGRVTEGPMCPGPVRIGDNSCPDQPYPATIIILNAENKKVAEVLADADGYFKIPLSPGTYTLHPVSVKPFPHAADQTVVVSAGEYNQVSIIYDTGMR